MSGKNAAVFGIFPDRRSLEQALEGLKAEGFRSTDISALFPQNVGTKDFARDKNTKLPEGAGAGTALFVGGALGWLSGMGALAIPGVGPFIAAGPMVGALAGAGVGGTVGCLIGSLVEMGVTEYEAKRYAAHIQKGGVLLSVHGADTEWTKKAKQIFEETGAEDSSSAVEARAYYAASDRRRPRTGHRSIAFRH